MKEKIKQLSIEEKVGQMFIIGVNKTNPIQLIENYILKNKVGGILLYKKNYKNLKELIDLVNYIKKINTVNPVPIFISTDQEGGRVNRMPKELKNLPSSHKLAQSEDENIVKQAGDIVGNMMHNLGFNLNLAPVLDIKRFPDDHVIGDRAFSEDKEIVFQKGQEYFEQIEKYGIIPVIKHFPGHGATTKDSHFGIPLIKGKNKELLEKEDKYPFEQMLKRKIDGVLVGHLKIEGQTGGYPATMSRKFVTKYIRKKYRYNGLLFTDDMRMGGVRRRYGKNKAVKKAFHSGYDIIVLKGIENDNVISEIVEEVKKSSILQSRVDRSVNRILKVKEKFEIQDKETIISEDFIEEINNNVKNIREKVGINN